MQSPYYQNASAFKPSEATLNEWLKTRKSKNINKPGFFETVDYSSDAGWSLVAILIEIFALFFTVYGAFAAYSQNHKMSIVISAIVVVILFVAFDVIGIKLFEFDKAEKIKAKSLIILESDPNKRQVLYEKIDEYTYRQFLGVMLIIISGAIKILAISGFALSGKGSIPMMLIISLFYLVVIYIHIFHTGFWLSARRVKAKMKKERENWYGDTQKGITTQLNVDTPEIRIFTSLHPMDRNLSTYQCGRQNIRELAKIESEDGIVSFQYELSSKGCLWDEDVNSILANFDGTKNFHHSLLKACIALQLSQTGMVVIYN